MTRTDGIITIFDMERMLLLLPPFSNLLWDFNSDIEERERDEAWHLSKKNLQIPSHKLGSSSFQLSKNTLESKMRWYPWWWCILISIRDKSIYKMKSENQFWTTFRGRYKTRAKREFWHSFASIFETLKRNERVQKFDSEWHFWGAEGKNSASQLLWNSFDTTPGTGVKGLSLKMRETKVQFPFAQEMT